MGLFLELIQYGRIQKTIKKTDVAPKIIILFNSGNKVCINNFNVTSLYELTFSRAASITVIPINGNIKKIIPNNGVT
ncbi:glycoprotein I [Flavobacterium psychrophilum]|nr:glycoprotein I [Flavobacterium psychrophilum]